MKKTLIMLMLGVAIMMVPISAFAITLYNQTLNGGFAGWEAAVSYIYGDWTIPTINPVGGWGTYNVLPDGNGINFGGYSLTYPGSGNFLNFTGGDTLNINFLSGVSNLGFEIDPISGTGQFSITAYLGPGGTLGTITNSWNSTSSPMFYGWTGGAIYGISIVSLNSTYGIGNMVEGGYGSSHAPVPEPAILLLVGSGLLGLVGLRKFKI